MKDSLVQSIQQADQFLGSMPGELQARVQSILSGSDDVAIFALSLYFNDCVHDRSYSALYTGLKNLERQKEHKLALEKRIA